MLGKLGFFYARFMDDWFSLDNHIIGLFPYLYGNSMISTLGRGRYSHVLSI
jgi:hypothetical protein